MKDEGQKWIQIDGLIMSKHLINYMILLKKVIIYIIYN